MTTFLPYIFSWWVILFYLGLISFPCLFVLFRRHNGRGIFFTKIFSLITITYLSWITGRFHILSFNKLNLFFLTILILVPSLYLWYRNSKDIVSWLRENYRLVLLTEIAFFLIFLFFSIIRIYNSSIIGEEKFMDLAFLNSICRTSFFPPPDPWMNGFHINYYYLGYLMNGIIIKMTSVDIPVGYNLALCSTGALTFLCCWGIVYGLTKNHCAGIFSSVLLVISGNYDGFIQVVRLHGFNGFDFFRSSRIIPDTINEFPFFSFILGDLHPHYTSLPVFIFALSVCLLWPAEIFSEENSIYHKLIFMFFTSFSTGFLFGSNFWNVPTCFFIICLSFLFQNMVNGEYKDKVIVFIAGAVMFSVILFIPFFIDFHSPTRIIIKIVSPAQRTFMYHFLICFFMFIFMFISPLYLILKEKFRKFKESQQMVWIYGISGIAIILYCIFQTGPIMFLLLFAVSVFAVIKFDSNKNIWLWSLWFAGFFILICCELFYLHDNYGHPYERMNTVFKFHYQVLVLFSIASGGAIHFMKERKAPGVFWLLLCLLFIPTLCYPCASSYVKPDWSDAELNGMKRYMEREHNSDFAAITWLNEHYSSLPKDPVILEATKDAYSYYSRVSTNTGIPAVLGWGNHEFVWRGDWGTVQKRQEDVKLLYETQDPDKAMELINKYGVSIVYWGELERNTYSAEGLPKFYKIMNVIYDKDGTVIFQKK